MSRTPAAPARAPDPDRRLLRRAALSVAAWTALAVAALVVTMTVLVVVIDEHQQHRQAEAVSRSAWADADDVNNPPAQTWLIVVTRSGHRRQTDGAPGTVDGIRPGDLRDGITRTVLDGRELVIYTGDHTFGRVSAVYDLSPRELEERRLQISLAVAALTGVLGAAVVGALIGRTAVRPLGAALTLQRRFVADASHELRTPLSVLLLRTQLLRRHVGPALTADQAAELDQLTRDTKVLGEVVNDLLLSAELQHRPQLGERVDLAELAVGIVESLRPLAEQKSITISALTPGLPAPDPVLVGPTGQRPTPRPAPDHAPPDHAPPDHAPPDHAPLVQGAPAALRRALGALIDNAIAHTPIGGHVQVAVSTDTTQVRVAVTDDGEGLDPALARRLVERFSRGTQAGDGRRFGLGLALVAEVARAHRGSLTVDGELGGGASFILAFPVYGT